MSNIVYIAASLDGYIARKDGSIDWLTEIPNPTNSDYGFNDFMERIDAIIMGRNTFETVLTFDEWPYDKPVYVLSSKLKTLPNDLYDKAYLHNCTPKEIMQLLNSEGLNNFYIDGGKTIQGFLKEDLIDELIITRVPIILGDGIPLFGEVIKEQRYAHQKTEVLNDMLVKSSYKRIK